MSKLLGYWNVSKTKMKTLAGEGNAGQYQDYLNNSLLCAIEEVREKLNKKISTAELNDFFMKVIRQAPAPVYGLKNVKFYYLTQINRRDRRCYTNWIFFIHNHPSRKSDGHLL